MDVNQGRAVFTTDPRSPVKDKKWYINTHKINECKKSITYYINIYLFTIMYCIYS